MKDPTHSLTIYLIKPGWSRSDCLSKLKKTTEHTFTLADGTQGSVFTNSIPAHPPKWVGLLSKAVPNLPTLPLRIGAPDRSDDQEFQKVSVIGVQGGVHKGVFHYRFLPKISSEKGQNRLNWRTKRLKLRKTLHLAGTIGGGKRIQGNPPPGTS